MGNYATYNMQVEINNSIENQTKAIEELKETINFNGALITSVLLFTIIFNFVRGCF